MLNRTSNVLITFAGMKKATKLPADTNKRAKSIVDLATQDKEGIVVDEIKAAAATLGRKGGLKGGNARAKSLTAEQRSEIAKKAAAARWKK
ncbi:MAG: hypothetical protein ABIQ31_17815 [Ferruginibacter sp.]